ncbi:hypothetical protein F5Y14DRAFT_460208 [Nemania sp. NC0429]|nr:hypothetical protein F5Y14DRAFT_460208 [Nemania sp. NC0429]
MRSPQPTQGEAETTASCFSGMQSRLANLLPGRRRSSAGTQRIPSSSATASTTASATAADSRPDHAESQPGRPPAPATYVPQHAAATFYKTATSRQMRKENEIL